MANTQQKQTHQSTEMQVDVQQQKASLIQSQQAHQFQVEAAKAKQKKALQMAREKALRLQTEARARAEASRAEQICQYQLQQAQQQQQQQLQQKQAQKQQIKVQQEAVKQQAEKRAQQLKAQNEAAKTQQQPRPQLQIPQQEKQQLNNQSLVKKQQAPQTAAKIVQPQVSQQQTLKPQQQNHVPNQQLTAQQNQRQEQQKQKQQGGAKLIASFGAYPSLYLIHYSKMGTQGKQQAPLAKQQKIKDLSWQLQRRVPQEEVRKINPERIKVPEFLDSSEVKPTVIVPTPAQSTRIQWNEFSEEEEKEQIEVPRVRVQEWVPKNNAEHIVQKTNYQPRQIGQAWPPPDYNEEKNFEIGRVNATKAISDNGWIQLNAEQNGEPNEDFAGNAPWRRKLSESSRVRSHVWPPVEENLETESFLTGPKLSVQWPPVKVEEKEQQDVQIIQTHLPVKPQQRQWPPVAAQ